MAVNHQKGQVTLLNFWLPPHLSPAQAETPLLAYQAMVDKHPEWAGRVRLIGISDHDVEEVQAKMADKTMSAVELYHVSD